MLFYEKTFLFVFLPILFILIFFISKKLDQKIFIFIFASIIFYSSWNIFYTPLILGTIFLNYYFGKILFYKKNKVKLYSFILFNVLLLILFKYLDFFIEIIVSITDLNIKKLEIPFPLAISFYTFQIITFLVDIYDNNIEKKNFNFKKFFLFVIFFPQLVAGPIIKYNFLINQFNDKNLSTFKTDNLIIGFSLIIIGLIKKVVFANFLSKIVDHGYNNIEILTVLDSWLISTAFTFQFYFDFSGYVDMALGIAFLFNIKLPINFNSPLKATSAINFWQRWHITLTNFLNNYLYFPLIRKFENINFFKIMLAIVVVFSIAGIWHGPSIMFLIFGLWHSFGIIVNHIYKKFSFYKNKLINLIHFFITFTFINISFIFFRSLNFNDALTLIKNLFFINNNYFLSTIYLSNQFNTHIIIFLLSFMIIFLFKNSNEIVEKYQTFSKLKQNKFINK
jgi:alginate O-acetyltransferase complex protein AlgI